MCERKCSGQPVALLARATRAVKGNSVTRFEGTKDQEVRRLGAPPAPRVRTVKRCSLDGRSEEHHSHLPPSTR
jgi:hypothetical protein